MTEGFIIKDIDTAPSIHEYLGELIPSDLRCDHQSQVTRVINPGQVIFTALENRLFRPSQVIGNRWLNCVYCPFMELPIPLTQTFGENVVLSTIQLLWVTLIPRLLLLIPLT